GQPVDQFGVGLQRAQRGDERFARQSEFFWRAVMRCAQQNDGLILQLVARRSAQAAVSRGVALPPAPRADVGRGGTDDRIWRGISMVTQIFIELFAQLFRLVWIAGA